MKLSTVERAALLRCRYAERYDNLQSPVRGTREEYAEEQAASFVKVHLLVFGRLVRRGLLAEVGPRYRLTDRGRAALQGMTVREAKA